MQATDGRARFAFEVQWSVQSTERYQLRTARYASEGIRTIWLRNCGLVRDDETRESDVRLEPWRVIVSGTEAKPSSTVLHEAHRLTVAAFVDAVLHDRLPTWTLPKSNAAIDGTRTPTPRRDETSFHEYIRQAGLAQLDGRVPPAPPRGFEQ